MQVLLAVYFFLAGLLVKGHPFMWLLPAVSCVCGLAHISLHHISNTFLPFYRCEGQGSQGHRDRENGGG
jgi:cyclopropane-fatty-acyl-phospholipid synthase